MPVRNRLVLTFCDGVATRCTLARVHPVEVAASIGVIGSATVAVVAYVSTAAATRRTLDAERERRNRDERSAAYKQCSGSC